MFNYILNKFYLFVFISSSPVESSGLVQHLFEMKKYFVKKL